MIRKLNNKGMSSIEILVSFIIVTAITISLFDVVLSYKTKQQVESYKSTITAYKNSVTKMIYDDIVKYKLANIAVLPSPEIYPVGATNDAILKLTYKVTLYFEKNLFNNSSCTSNYNAAGCYKTLKVVRNMNAEDETKANVDYIEYPEVANDEFKSPTPKYYLPDIGGNYNEEKENAYTKDIRFASVNFKEVMDNAVLDIAIYHHELSTYYHVQITAPINYYALTNDSFIVQG